MAKRTVKIGGVLISIDGDDARFAAASRRVVRQFDRQQRAMKVTQARALGMTNTLRGLESRLVGIGAAYGVLRGARAFVALADEATVLETRLRLVTQSAAELEAKWVDLLALSQYTRVSFRLSVELYQRMAIALRSAGVETGRLLDLTQGVNQAVILSGATVQAAAAGMIQFSQGLASSRLAGDELRSVLENLPRLALAIADGLGITIGELREWGRQSKLTAETVIGSLLTQLPALDEEFQRVQRTIGQAWQQTSNVFLDLVRDVDDATDASTRMIEVVDTLRGLIESRPFQAGFQDLADLFSYLTKGIAGALEAMEDWIAFIRENKAAVSIALGLGAGAAAAKGRFALATSLVSVGSAVAGIDNRDAAEKTADQVELVERLEQAFKTAREEEKRFARDFAAGFEAASRPLEAARAKVEELRLELKRARLEAGLVLVPEQADPDDFFSGSAEVPTAVAAGVDLDAFASYYEEYAESLREAARLLARADRDRRREADRLTQSLMGKYAEIDRLRPLEADMLALGRAMADQERAFREELDRTSEALKARYVEIDRNRLEDDMLALGGVIDRHAEEEWREQQAALRELRAEQEALTESLMAKYAELDRLRSLESDMLALGRAMAAQDRARREEADRLREAVRKLFDELDRNRFEDDMTALGEIMARGSRQALTTWQQAAKGISDSLGDAVSSAITDFENLGESVRSVVRAIVAELARVFIARPIASAIGSAFGLPAAPGRAAGGPVSAGRPYTVGERGVELFVPERDGHIVSASDFRAGAGAVTVAPVFNIQSSDGPAVRAALEAALPQFVEVAEATVARNLGRPSKLRYVATGR